MSLEINESILLRSIEQWGGDAQMEMVVEECAELIQAVQKTKRHQLKEQYIKSMENLIDEIADVTILMRQMAVLHGEHAIQERIDFKMKRLEFRVSQSENL